MRNQRRIVTLDRDFSPASIPNLVAWYKADALNLNDGDAVSSWTDSSGRGNHAVQASGTLQPLFKKNILKGLPVVRFDGSNDYLRTGTLSPRLTQPSTIYTVARDTTGTGTQTVYDGYYTDSERQNLVFISNKLSAYAGTQLTDTATVGTEFIKVNVVYNGTASTIRLGLSVYKAGSIGTLQPTVLTIGALFNLFFPLSGDIAEIIFALGIHSAGLIAKVERYFNIKYGI